MRKKKNEAPVASRVVLYTRVSSDQQGEEGHSLAAQERKLEAYAAALGLEIVGRCSDIASASSVDRSGLQTALRMLESKRADGLLVVKLDRLTRNLRDLLDLVDEYFRDGDVSLLSVGESIDTRSAGGRMMLNILTVIGQWEREAIGERTSAVLQHMKAAGMFTGGFPPYGFALVDGDLVEDEFEQGNLVKARAYRAAGHTLRTIAVALGINRRTGKAFAASQIARMCVV